MKNFKFATLLAILTVGSLLSAQSPDRIQNEDLKFIRDWVHSQMVSELASQLQLSAEQVATLRATRVEVDAIKAEYEPQIEAARTALETTAATVRANIEATNSFSDEDKNALRAAKLTLRELRHGQKAALHEAVIGLKELLTPDQIQVIKDIMKSHRPAGEPGEGAGLGPAPGQGQGQGMGQGMGRGQGGQRGAAAMVRILLSDDFLSQYQ